MLAFTTMVIPSVKLSLAIYATLKLHESNRKFTQQLFIHMHAIESHIHTHKKWKKSSAKWPSPKGIVLCCTHTHKTPHDRNRYAGIPRLEVQEIEIQSAAQGLCPNADFHLNISSTAFTVYLMLIFIHEPR